jgi:hypothetical protein
MRPPKYSKKTDRVIHPQASQDDIKCDVAVAGLTRAMEQMDKKWGYGVLVGLTGPETIAKWGKAVAGLYAAEDEKDAGRVAGWAEVCVRGLALMDAEATEAGHKPADPHIWEYEFEGVTYGIIEDGRQWPAAYRKRKGLVMFNMREVAIALDAHRNDLVRKVKDGFPGAEITAIRQPTNDSLDDDLDEVFE